MQNFVLLKAKRNRLFVVCIYYIHLDEQRRKEFYCLPHRGNEQLQCQLPQKLLIERKKISVELITACGRQ